MLSCLERETGFEPATPSLEGWRSTAELFPRRDIPCRPDLLCPVASWSHAPSPIARTRTPRWWRGEDLNPRRRSPADLQSAPFGQLGYLAIRTVDSSGTHSAGRRPALVAQPARGEPGLFTVELAKGIEPPACCLQGSRSTPELRQQATKLHPMYHPRSCQPISWRARPQDVHGHPATAAAGSRRAGRPPPPPR